MCESKSGLGFKPDSELFGLETQNGVFGKIIYHAKNVPFLLSATMDSLVWYLPLHAGTVLLWQVLCRTCTLGAYGQKLRWVLDKGVDADLAGFGFEVSGFGFRFEIPRFAHHCLEFSERWQITEIYFVQSSFPSKTQCHEMANIASKMKVDI